MRAVGGGVVAHPDRAPGGGARGRGSSPRGCSCIRTGRPVRRASRQVCTCRLMSSRAPNAPPTPPSVEPHLRSGEAEAGGDLLAVLVQPLRGDVQLDAAAARVGHGQRRLEPEERLVLHADLVGALDDDRRRWRRGRRGTMRWWRMHVAVGMDRRVAAVDRRLGVDQRRRAPRTRRRSPPAPAGTSRGGRRRPPRPARRRSARRRAANTGWSWLIEPVGRLAGHVVGGDARRRRRRSPAPATTSMRTIRAYGCGERSVAPHSMPSADRSDENAKRALHLGDAVGARRRLSPMRGRARRRRRVGRGVGHASSAAASRSTATRCTASMIRP